MKFSVITFLLVALVILSGCASTDVNDEIPVHNVTEPGASEPMGDIYMPQSFGTMVVRGYESLVEFTVLSSTRVEGEVVGDYLGRDDVFAPIWGTDYYYLLVLYIDDVLMEGSYWDWPSKGDEINIVIHQTSPLEEGQQYLTFINPMSLDGRFISKINNDRTITAIPTGHYFKEYNGYTVEQIREIATEILLNGYTPEWGEITGTCIIEDSGVLEAPKPSKPAFNFVEPGGSIAIEGLDGIEVIDEAWDLDLD